MKTVVAAFNKEKALVGAFSVIVQLHRLIVYSTTAHLLGPDVGEALEERGRRGGGQREGSRLVQPRHQRLRPRLRLQHGVGGGTQVRGVVILGACRHASGC